jgi:Autoinducer binding domain
MNWFAEILDDLIAQNDRIGSDTAAELRRVRDRLSKDGGLLPRHEATDLIQTQISEALSLDQVAAVFERIPSTFGFDDATLIVLSEGGNYLSRRVLSTLPDAWWSAYYDLRLYNDDPLIAGILGRDHELFLDELVPADSDAPLPYTRAALAHSIGVGGVMFKLSYPSGVVAAVVLNSVRTPDYVRRQYRKYRDDLQALAFAACDALMHFSPMAVPSKVELTGEEIHMLRLIATSADPMRALASDPSFGVGAALQGQILRKLGVKSIFQAILIAARRGLLDAAIFHPNDVLTTRPLVAGWDVLRLGLSSDPEDAHP